MANRLSHLRRRLEEYGADALLLSSLSNVRWACGFTGSNGLLLVTRDESVFVTDGRYTEQARQEVSGAEVVIAENGLVSHLRSLDYFAPLERVVFQADEVTVSRREKLEERLPEVAWIAKTDVLTRRVASKDSTEVGRIRKAQKITETVFDRVLGLLEPGLSERDIAAEITYQHLKQGADKMAFDPIVASGPNGARPHARPTNRNLRSGELVVLDMGCYRDGYASDMTRTVAIGTPSDAARRGYEAVLTAQKKALDAARAGVPGKALDAVARDAIKESGFEGYFSHGLGHGIGLDVHEWPRVSKTVDTELPDGACVTIEPGIYVAEEEYGVRIEDIVHLHSEGCTNLTSVEKELLIL